MKATVHLVDPEDRIAVEVDARDRRSFERIAKRDLGRVADGPLKEVIGAIPETYILWLAWHALAIRTKAIDLTWPDFEARTVEVEVEDDEEEAETDPTERGATGD